MNIYCNESWTGGRPALALQLSGHALGGRLWACQSWLNTVHWIRPRIPLIPDIPALYFMHVCSHAWTCMYGSMIISVIGFLMNALCKHMCMWARSCVWVGLCGSKSKAISNISGVMEWRALFTETEADKSPSHEFGLCSDSKRWRSRKSEPSLSYPLLCRVWESSGWTELGGGLRL